MMGKKQAICLTPSFIQKDFFLSYDIEFLVRRFKSELSYLHRNWTELGRPTVTVYCSLTICWAHRSHYLLCLDESRLPAVKLTAFLLASRHHGAVIQYRSGLSMSST